jgi:SAM-dependent methyltransferase
MTYGHVTVVVRRAYFIVAAAVIAFAAGFVVSELSGRWRPEGPRAGASSDPSSSAAVFGEIYANAAWGKNRGDAGTSGFGSSLGATIIYRTYLEHFMAELGVRSVVDAGCGDWEFSQAIDWNGIDYKGYDIVPSVIEQDRAKFEKPNVHFFVANIVEADLPPADLLIVKHVLQHLPTASVQRFLVQLPKYKHVLLVDSVNRVTLSAKNTDIEVGSFRELDVTRPPFDVRGTKVLTYWDGGNMQQVVYAAGHP